MEGDSGATRRSTRFVSAGLSMNSAGKQTRLALTHCILLCSHLVLLGYIHFYLQSLERRIAVTPQFIFICFSNFLFSSVFPVSGVHGQNISMPVKSYHRLTAVDRKHFPFTIYCTVELHLLISCVVFECVRVFVCVCVCRKIFLMRASAARHFFLAVRLCLLLSLRAQFKRAVRMCLFFNARCSCSPPPPPFFFLLCAYCVPPSECAGQLVRAGCAHSVAPRCRCSGSDVPVGRQRRAG